MGLVMDLKWTSGTTSSRFFSFSLFTMKEQATYLILIYSVILLLSYNLLLRIYTFAQLFTMKDFVLCCNTVTG